jgi:molybdate transport system substrate-binding protein
VRFGPWSAGAGALVLIAGCGGGAAGGPDGGGSPIPAERRTLDVAAASSFSEAFPELEQRFEEIRPGVDVVFDFGAPADLAQRIVDGGPADLFAADEPGMRAALDAGRVEGEPTAFATDVLQIATAPGNPEGIASFADLARPGVTVAVCEPRLPCGAAAQRIAQATGVPLRPSSEEADAASALGEVTTDTADAALVHTADVYAAGNRVQGVEFPESALAVDHYQIAVVAGAAEADLARAFQALVTGPDGRAVLGAAGFGRP